MVSGELSVLVLLEPLCRVRGRPDESEELHTMLRLLNPVVWAGHILCRLVPRL